MIGIRQWNDFISTFSWPDFISFALGTQAFALANLLRLMNSPSAWSDSSWCSPVEFPPSSPHRFCGFPIWSQEFLSSALVGFDSSVSMGFASFVFLSWCPSIHCRPSFPYLLTALCSSFWISTSISVSTFPVAFISNCCSVRSLRTSSCP